MYATCSQGHQHWGPVGAAGGLIIAPTLTGPQVLLTLRSAQVHQGGTWSVPGGAIDAGDADDHAAACREIHEELGLDVSTLPVLGRHRFECGGWTYVTVILGATDPTPLVASGWETDQVTWFTLDRVDDLATSGRLHPSFARSWPELRRLVALTPAA